MTDLVPVILAGGTGTRLWPLSRELFPKQFHSLLGNGSLLQATLARLSGLEHEAPILVCSEMHRFMVAEQCREVNAPSPTIILEPAPRNTAPAIALAALSALATHDDPVLLVLPSDHFIRDVAGFQHAVSRVAGGDLGDALYTFGILPERAESGYGYIECGNAPDPSAAACAVSAFVEKPDADQAQQFVASGRHFWNSGMFLFRARAYLEELQRFRPDIQAGVMRSFEQGAVDMDFFRPSAAFADCPNDSIDYAVMEQTRNAMMIPVSIGWSDVGSWSSLWALAERDARGNASIGDVIDVGSNDSLVYADHRLVATIGLRDTVVIETRDAVLVADKERVQEVKTVVEGLKSCTRHEHETHVKVYRPWGSYESVEDGDRYQVKRITVNPGATLSLQMHHHRSEHWIVVRGTAQVEREDETFVLSENESTYIPLGSRHRLGNPGKLPLELIEVQVGPYLGEDDIVRIDDRYGRS